MKKNQIITGIGQDSHRFVDDTDNKKLVLGGVTIDDHKGLIGNSDADIVLHSLFNALSQALGCKSIGYYADKLCLEKGITDSKEYIKIMLLKIKIKKYRISHIGISLECKTPNIEKHHDHIKLSLMRIFNIKKKQIGINATSGEGLTSFGQGLGMQCLSIVTLEKLPPPFYKKPTFIIFFSLIFVYLMAIYWLINSMDSIF